MKYYHILIILAALLALVLIAALVCFLMVFYSSKRKERGEDEYDIPPGRVYEIHRERIVNWIKQIRSMPHEDVEIMSYDGLKLRGRYYECKKGAPIELLFHGYRGDSERDLCGGVERCFSLGRNALIIDQRASGRSEGRIITFGIREHRDCLSWVNYATDRFGPDTKILITGISMGAATVMMAAGKDLPDNVVGVLADCGYSSARDIIKKVVRELKLPVAIFYPLIRLGGLIYGGFDIESYSPIEAMKKCRLPIIFIHGDSDTFVPSYMSEELYEVCSAKRKKLVIVPNAAHGLAFVIDSVGYVNALDEFQIECKSNT